MASSGVEELSWSCTSPGWKSSCMGMCAASAPHSDYQDPSAPLSGSLSLHYRLSLRSALGFWNHQGRYRHYRSLHSSIPDAFYSGTELSVRNTLHFSNCPFTQFLKLSTNMEQFSFVGLASPRTLSALCTGVLCHRMDGQPEAIT